MVSRTKEQKPENKSLIVKIKNWNEKAKQNAVIEQNRRIELDKQKFYSVKPYKVYQALKWTEIGKIINKWEVQKNQSKVFLIHMELDNGKHRQFTILTEFGSFVFNNKRYLIDEECKYDDIDAKLWCLDYHESLCLPIKRHIPRNDLIREAEQQSEKIYEMLLNHDDSRVRKAIAEIPKPDIVYAINPENLERFMISKVIEKVIKGGEMDDIFSFLKTMTWVNTIILGIELLLIIVIVFKS